MAKSCKACKELKDRGIDVDCCFEIGDKECENLQNDQGFNGKTNDCEDMHDLNDCLLGRADSGLTIHDDCDWKGYMRKLLTILYNLFKMIICAICGLWKKIHELEQQNWQINTRYGIQEATKGMSVSINRSNGDFVFKWKDWGNAEQTEYLGEGELRGTVNFGMRSASKSSFDWQIREVVIQSMKYTSNNIRPLDFTLHLYFTKSGEQEIYTKKHNTMSSFTDTINKTLKMNKKGNVGKGSSSGWIQFLEFFNNGTVADDRANLQIEFKNTGQANPPAYID